MLNMRRDGHVLLFSSVASAKKEKKKKKAKISDDEIGVIILHCCPFVSI